MGVQSRCSPARALDPSSHLAPASPRVGLGKEGGERSGAKRARRGSEARSRARAAPTDRDPLDCAPGASRQKEPRTEWSGPQAHCKFPMYNYCKKKSSDTFSFFRHFFHGFSISRALITRPVHNKSYDLSTRVRGLSDEGGSWFWSYL